MSLSMRIVSVPFMCYSVTHTAGRLTLALRAQVHAAEGGQPVVANEPQALCEAEGEGQAEASWHQPSADRPRR